MTDASIAKAFFQQANERFSRRHYLDAQRLYKKAHALDPQNQAYADACHRLADTVHAFLGKGKLRKPSAADTCDCSANCCECCGEICGEGCCEALCEGCDCDCG